MSENTVYVAEAYKDGQRIEQLVHTSYRDAKGDIEISTNLDDPDEIQIHERRLWLGEHEKFVAKR